MGNRNSRCLNQGSVASTLRKRNLLGSGRKIELNKKVVRTVVLIRDVVAWGSKRFFQEGKLSDSARVECDVENLTAALVARAKKPSVRCRYQ